MRACVCGPGEDAAYGALRSPVEPVTIVLVTVAAPVLGLFLVGLVLVVLWWRRQESRRMGSITENSEPASLLDPAQDRRRRDARQRGLMG